MKCLTLTLLVSATAALAAAADHSFAGTWKMNLEKSHLTGQMSIVTKLPNGMMHEVDGAIGFDYRVDGKDYPTVPGMTMAVTQSGENSWDSVFKKDGKVQGTGHLHLSKDGNTIERTYTFYRPDGQTDNGSSTAQRVSGGPGLLGTWKDTKVNVGAAWTIVIEMPAPDEISTRSIEGKTSWHGKCDGSDVANEGPLAIKGDTNACKMVNARTIEWTERLNGKVTSLDRQTLAADGRTIEDVSWAPGKEGEKVTVIWDRQ